MIEFPYSITIEKWVSTEIPVYLHGLSTKPSVMQKSKISDTWRMFFEHEDVITTTGWYIAVPKLSRVITEWLRTNIGKKGIDWMDDSIDIKSYPNNSTSKKSYTISFKTDEHRVLFKLTWL